MSNNHINIIRSGINTTFQDKGRDHLYHIGIPFSGAMDNRNFLIANKLVNNNLNSAVIEFAYQGPIEGHCYKSYQIENGDEINIISTNKSVYGYLALGGEFDLKLQWNSCSINTKANIGSNDGKKLETDQKINLIKINANKDIKKTNYTNSKIENIRVIKGTNFEYFSEEGKKIFYDKEFTVSKLSDRMGMRLEGPKIDNIVNLK